MQNNIEVELRGQLSQAEFQRVTDYLTHHSEHLEKDDKKTYFFVTDDVILKITDEQTKGNAKITIKNGDETKDIVREFEINIHRRFIDDSLNMFNLLGFTKLNIINQVRVNYIYKGVSIAMKYTPDWQYHFEIDVMVRSNKEAQEQKIYLRSICNELGITPMNPKEIKEKILQINKEHGYI